MFKNTMNSASITMAHNPNQAITNQEW